MRARIITDVTIFFFCNRNANTFQKSENTFQWYFLSAHRALRNVLRPSALPQLGGGANCREEDAHRGANSISEQKPELPLNILQCTGHPPIAKHSLVKHANSAMVLVNF